MTKELTYLTAVAALTGLLWVPYILDRMATRGIVAAVGYGPSTKPQSAWAERLRHAHQNAVENLVVFAVLVLIAAAAGIHTEVVATAAIVYFWARVVHAVAFTFAVPWVRTVAFLVGFLAQAAVAWQLVVAR